MKTQATATIIINQGRGFCRWPVAVAFLSLLTLAGAVRVQATNIFCRDTFHRMGVLAGSALSSGGVGSTQWSSCPELFIGRRGIGFHTQGYDIEPWPPVKRQTVKLDLPYMGKTVEYINNASGSVSAPTRIQASEHVLSKPAVCGTGQQQMALNRELRRLYKEGVCGTRLQQMVMSRCEHIAYWNRPYQYNGIGDCYGYCRQVWNAILADGKEHTEDYYPNKYDKKRWIDFKGGIPVNTFPDTNWVYFSNSKVLVPGDLLATDQGHFWGPDWHGGIYAGNGNDWDCSKHGGLNGAYKRPLFRGFHYYYKPLHELLLGNSSIPITSAWR